MTGKGMGIEYALKKIRVHKKFAPDAYENYLWTLLCGCQILMSSTLKRVLLRHTTESPSSYLRTIFLSRIITNP